MLVEISGKAVMMPPMASPPVFHAPSSPLPFAAAAAPSSASAWPHQRQAGMVFWGGVTALVVMALGSTQLHFHQRENEAAAAQAALQQGIKARWQEVAELTRHTATLSLSADTKELEGQLAMVVKQLPKEVNEDPTVRDYQGQLHQHLATLAQQRSDYMAGLNELKQATTLTAEPNRLAAIALQRLELLLAADPTTSLAQTAVAPVSAAVQALPAGEGKATAILHLAVLQAEVASAHAAAVTAEDQVRRELQVAQLKRKGLALSEQLRAEMNAEYQKRDQAQQDATTRNDPAQMAQSIKDKDLFDEKFSTELKRREEQFQAETKAALQPDPQISALQAASVEAWQKLAEPPLESAWSLRIQLGLAAAYLEQQNFPAANNALAVAMTAKSPTTLELATTKHLQARILQAQAARLSGPAATAVYQQALNSATEAHKQLAKISLHRPELMEQSAAIEATLAALHALVGQKDAAAQFQSAAEKNSQAAAQDHRWREILWNAQNKLEQLRIALRAKYQPELVEQLASAQSLVEALRQWQFLQLTEQDSGLPQKRVQSILQAAPGQYPWASLFKEVQ
jgi:hypothetical protein